MMHLKPSEIIEYIQNAMRVHKKFVSLLFVLALLAVIPFTIEALNYGYHAKEHAAALRPTSQKLKRLTLYPTHLHKPACVWKGLGYARCFAEEAVLSNGKPLVASSPQKLLPANVLMAQTATDPTQPAATIDEYAPTRFHTAYNVPCTPGGPVQTTCQASSFGPTTIAIIMGGDTPSVEQDLATASQQFGLPSCTKANGCLTVINQNGGSQLPQADPGAYLETLMDTQTAHAMCQTCKIVLVEANDMYMQNIATAVNTAASLHPAVISISLGGPEDSSLSQIDSAFHHPGIAIVVANGDWCYNDTCPQQTGYPAGAGANFPASSPGVIAVGGTTLHLNTDNTYAGETVWPESGSGCSQVFSALSSQTGVPNWSALGCGSQRSAADVAAVADQTTGSAVYNSTAGGWQLVGGTSLATPVVASIIALTGNGIDPSTPYSHASEFHDIASGSNGSCGGSAICAGVAGFDGPTGLGSPNGLAGFGGSSGTGGGGPSPTPVSISPTPTPVSGFPSPTPVISRFPTIPPISPTTPIGYPTPTGSSGSGTSATLAVTFDAISSAASAKIVTVEFYNIQTGAKDSSAQISVDKQPDGTFQGLISAPSSGQYFIKVKADGYLRKQAQQTLPLSNSDIINVELPVGDVNGDNVLDLRDVSALQGCLNAPSASCTSSATHTNADLNADGKIDILDYNTLLGAFATVQGQ